MGEESTEVLAVQSDIRAEKKGFLLSRRDWMKWVGLGGAGVVIGARAVESSDEVKDTLRFLMD